MPRLTSRPRRDQASRAISTARLKRSRALHLPPINVVVSHGPLGVLRPGSVHLGEGFPLRCIQRLSRATSLTGVALGRTAGTREVASSGSSRTTDDAPQHSNAHTGYRPNCLTTF